MSRGLFTKKKKSVVSRTTERDYEREVKKLEELDEATKKLSENMKRSMKANTAAVKSEKKMMQDLLTSDVCQHDEFGLRNVVEGWDTAITKIDLHMRDLNSVCQKVVMDPIKKLSSMFPNVQTAVKKRDQSLQEYTRCQTRMEKYQDKERTGPNIIKIETSKKALQIARDDFNTQNDALMKDLPKFYDGRIDYFQPSFEALVKAQVTYFAESFKIYSELSTQLNEKTDLSEEDYNTTIQQKLAEIRGLSITVD